MKSIFIGGRVFTGSLPLVAAFAVENGRFCAVGTDAELLALRTDGDTVMRPIEADVDRKLLQDAVGKLSSRERDIISLRFGLGGKKEMTQKEVADRMGISQSYISRLEKRIILRLKREILKMS